MSDRDAVVIHVRAGAADGDGSAGHPFGTLAAARDAARRTLAEGCRDVDVLLAAGRFELDNTLELTEADSAPPGGRISYRGPSAGSAVISGGQVVPGWTEGGGGVWSAPVAGPVRQLVVDGARRRRASRPAAGGYLRIDHWDSVRRLIAVPANEIGDLGNLPNLQGLELRLQQTWEESYLRVRGVHVEGQLALIEVEEPERSLLFDRPFPMKLDGQVVAFEGIPELLTEAGTWIYSAAESSLNYLPLPGERLPDIRAVVPRCETLIRLDGAARLTLSGLTLEHAGWNRASVTGHLGVQAAQYDLTADTDNHHTVGRPPSALRIAHCDELEIRANQFRNHAATAIDLIDDVHHTVVSGNLVEQCGGTGIAVGALTSEDQDISELPPFDATDKMTSDVLVTDNVVRQIGLDYRGAVGILAGHVRQCVIEHNEISDLPYTGISIGWGWQRVPSPARDNVIRYNRLSRVMLELADGAAIYALGQQPGSYIVGNHISDLRRGPWAYTAAPIAAIFLDEGAGGFYVAHNLIADVPVRFNANLAHPMIVVDDEILSEAIAAVAGIRHLTPPAPQPLSPSPSPLDREGRG